ncbi:hypothetical protein H663_020100 [Limnohabitans planktonicus II-D5]|uniref:Uncharacterized protein n=1 Tax=Limnohabitans planktonicus II-D5 TaxID=1293045 RepID=A0A2T7ST90_9BURK|nr:hypothetical protein H663_020100 [Limnohabitans planktonicus II-D5]
MARQLLAMTAWVMARPIGRHGERSVTIQCLHCHHFWIVMSQPPRHTEHPVIASESGDPVFGQT